jgi:hypothetical protein
VLCYYICNCAVNFFNANVLTRDRRICLQVKLVITQHLVFQQKGTLCRPEKLNLALEQINVFEKVRLEQTLFINHVKIMLAGANEDFRDRMNETTFSSKTQEKRNFRCSSFRQKFSLEVCQTKICFFSYQMFKTLI